MLMILVDLMLMLNSGYVTTLNKIYRNINLALVMALYFLKYLPLCIYCFGDYSDYFLAPAECSYT